MKLGDVVPNFQFTATNGINANLADYHGQWIILYFYPKDATPGCTTQGQDFRDSYLKFQELNASVFGISRDSIKSHENFKCKQTFPFELISDSSENLCELFEVIKMKTMYGKQVRGIERSTFIINPQGKLVHQWRKVSVPNHVDDVLATLKKLQKNDTSHLGENTH
ncbi:bacterioferritin comigratory protein [Legionella beliardensis]|uniref:thioredoxin-dependent peroxiredoxin n=1 Tax=Legionella beliardensis TaxID=91822 RepID=A0A378I503_9GAMM|nr:peroxiredoxin [Legionella beliardensis]STX27584.1 bacterioferritin comigratory protein [Legionella beliardensis]